MMASPLRRAPECRRGLLLLGLAALLAGCGSTQEHRARQYSQAFAAMSPSQQDRVLEGVIATGDSRKAVYIALGPPQAQRFIAHIEVWEYLAREVPGDSGSNGENQARFITPNSDEWKSVWGGNPGYLVIEFDQDAVDVWDYDAEGYALKLQPGQRIVLPQNQP